MTVQKPENALNWGFLNDEEEKALEDMMAEGIEPCLAPIEIEHGNAMQLESLSITSEQFRTWEIGPEKRTVHPTPCSKEVADFLINDMRKEHRQTYRKVRCKIPGTRKPLIRCPESNKCSNCPFPAYRDAHQPDDLSWEQMIDDAGNETGQEDPGIHNAEVRELLREVIAEMDAKNPKYFRALALQFIGYNVHEIAAALNESESNIYYFLRKAMEIGKDFKKRNDL